MSTNRHPATCTKCRGRIDAGKGTLTGKVAGRWTAIHTDTCDGSLDLRPEPVAPPVELSWFERQCLDALREAGGNQDAALRLLCEWNEGWDGEPEPAAAAKRHLRLLAHTDWAMAS